MFTNKNTLTLLEVSLTEFIFEEEATVLAEVNYDEISPAYPQEYRTQLRAVECYIDSQLAQIAEDWMCFPEKSH